ncbi:MAG: DUF4956 domain-containing protein [Coprobacillaceae bacterium]
MLESIFNTAVENTSLTLQVIIITMLASFVLGVIIGITYLKTSKRNEVTNDFIITIILLPILMSTIILLIGNNIAGAFSLAGIFSVIRFRSAPGSTKDIVFILFCVGVGLACGIQAYTYAMLFTVLVCGCLYMLSLVTRYQGKQIYMQVKILVPENLNFENIFDEIFEEYTVNYDFDYMRTKDLGSVYELGYSVLFKKDINKKEFMDNIRCRNGNFTIQMHLKTPLKN